MHPTIPSVNSINEAITHYKKVIKNSEPNRQYFLSEIRKHHGDQKTVAKKNLEILNLGTKKDTVSLNYYLKLLKNVTEHHDSYSAYNRKISRLYREIDKLNKTKNKTVHKKSIFNNSYNNAFKS